MDIERVVVELSETEHRVLDPADVCFLAGAGGRTEVRLRGRGSVPGSPFHGCLAVQPVLAVAAASNIAAPRAMRGRQGMNFPFIGRE
jgi:hypothetical protein